MTTVCLTMIVKNEAHVIERCLASARPLIDHWVIVDTGSTDGTQEKIRRVMDGIPGEIVERPWKNFGHNRTEALALARPTADYSLWIDADDEFIREPGVRFDGLTADAYSISVEDAGCSYRRKHLLKNTLPWQFEGVLHEYPLAAGATAMAFYGVTYHRIGGGARSGDPEKFASDARLLEEALRADPDNARYAFYLAQSRRDAKQYREAIDAYERRAEMGGWDEEVWTSFYQIARIHERLGAAPPIVWSAYLRAFQYRPRRAEAMCALARYCRARKEWALGLTFATTAMSTSRPSDILFVEDAVYDWRALDEYAIAAYWTGNDALAVAANERLLDEGKLPAEERARVQTNLGFSFARTKAAPPRLRTRRPAERTMKSHENAVLLAAYFAIPLASFFALAALMASCASPVDPPPGPAPDTSHPTKHENAPPVPVDCPSGTTEEQREGGSWCCTKNHCDAKGAPIYGAGCPAAGERRVGTVYTYTQSSSTSEAAAFKSAEQWVSIEYECRSEDGIAPTWAYVEPASHCIRLVTRDPAGASSDHSAGALCEPVK